VATAEELQKFLSKRGFDVDVAKDGATYSIKVRAKTASEVSKVLAQIDEPGRFVIDADLMDITDILVEKSGLLALISDLTVEVGEWKDKMTRNMDSLTETDDKLREQSTDSISGLKEIIKEQDKKIATLIDVVEALTERAVIQDNKPSFLKRLIGRK